MVQLAVEDSTADIVTYDQLMVRFEGELSRAIDDEAKETLSLQVEVDGQYSSPCAEAEALPTRPSLRQHLLRPRINLRMERSGIALVDGSSAANLYECALLGTISMEDSSGSDRDDQEVYLNTHEPFCFATVGVQGAGKSHTLACILESCMIPVPEDNVIRLQNPMSALVLHYDQSVTSVCEATGLVSARKDIPRPSSSSAPQLSKDKMVVLVSPTFYKQRKAFYGDRCTVKPLLFQWNRH